MFWVTRYLVEYGFASLFLGMLVEEMLISHLHWPLVNGCWIFPLPSCSEYFCFHISVTKTQSLGIRFCSSRTAAEPRLWRETWKTRSPGAGEWVPALLPEHLAHQKRREEKFLLQPSGLPEVGGEREGQEHWFERQKKPQAGCSCYTEFFEVSVLFYLSWLGLLVPGKSWYVLALIHICSAFESPPASGNKQTNKQNLLKCKCWALPSFSVFPWKQFFQIYHEGEAAEKLSGTHS